MIQDCTTCGIRSTCPRIGGGPTCLSWTKAFKPYPVTDETTRKQRNRAMLLKMRARKA